MLTKRMQLEATLVSSREFVRGRRLRSYFAKCHTCMSVTQCLGALEVLLSTYDALVMVKTLTFNFLFILLLFLPILGHLIFCMYCSSLSK